MNLEQLYSGYIDSNGLVQPEKGSTSDNGIRFTAEAFLAHWTAAKWHRLQYADESQVQFCLALAQAIGKCATGGLLRRFPGSKTQEGPDDYIAALAVSYMLGSRLAMHIYNHGLDHYGFFFTEPLSLKTTWKDFKSAFLWRNVSLAAFAKFCAVGKLGKIGQLIIAISLLIAARSKEQDSKVLSWFMVLCFKDSYSVINMAITYWKRKLKEQYPGGIGEVLGEYYSPEHYNHPNSKSLMNVFDSTSI